MKAARLDSILFLSVSWSVSALQGVKVENVEICAQGKTASLHVATPREHISGQRIVEFDNFDSSGEVAMRLGSEGSVRASNGGTSGICKGWCRTHAKSWAVKCGWKNCWGCSECNEPEPTAEAPDEDEEDSSSSNEPEPTAEAPDEDEEDSSSSNEPEPAAEAPDEDADSNEDEEDSNEDEEASGAALAYTLLGKGTCADYHNDLNSLNEWVASFTWSQCAKKCDEEYLCTGFTYPTDGTFCSLYRSDCSTTVHEGGAHDVTCYKKTPPCSDINGGTSLDYPCKCGLTRAAAAQCNTSAQVCAARDDNDGVCQDKCSTYSNDCPAGTVKLLQKACGATCDEATCCEAGGFVRSSDGSSSLPFCNGCTSIYQKRWNDKSKERCAMGLCVAAGYVRGTYLSTDEDPCKGGQVIETGSWIDMNTGSKLETTNQARGGMVAITAFCQAVDTPAPGGTCADPDPNSAGTGKYICIDLVRPNALVPMQKKKGADSADCQSVSECDANCCEVVGGEVVNAPAPGGTCFDPDPNSPGDGDYVCPTKSIAKVSAESQACTDTASCIANCCEATCATYTNACPDGKVNVGTDKGCGGTACDEATCCEGPVWHLAKQGESCRSSCQSDATQCVESAWPRDLAAFQSIMESTGVTCTSIEEGRGKLNPATYLGYGSPGKCYWKSPALTPIPGSAAELSCDGGVVPYARFCPCVQVPCDVDSDCTTGSVCGHEKVCEAACTVPTTPGYNTDSAGGNLMISGFSPTGVTCASGYVGDVTYSACESAGKAYIVSGCQATCAAYQCGAYSKTKSGVDSVTDANQEKCCEVSCDSCKKCVHKGRCKGWKRMTQEKCGRIGGLWCTA